MPKGFTAIFLLIIFACSSNPKSEENNEIKTIVKRVELVNWDVIPKVNELQFYNVNTFLDASGMMYENYGNYNERMVSKYQPYTDRVVWNNVQLFEDSSETYTVITDGIHKIHPGFTCFMVFDAKGRDCLKDSHPRKKELMLLFRNKIENVSSKSLTRFRMDLNEEEGYRAHIHETRGQFEENKYEHLLTNLKKELDTAITSDKSILIQFKQDAPYCYMQDSVTHKNRLKIRDEIRISKNISRKFSLQNYFVYEENSPFVALFNEMEAYTLDSGYFYKSIFKEHQNCSAFLLIKPDGRYVKYFGEDYYSIISDFLEE